MLVLCPGESEASVQRKNGVQRLQLGEGLEPGATCLIKFVRPCGCKASL